MKHTKLRLPEQLIQDIKQIADTEKISVSLFIRATLSDYVKLYQFNNPKK